ncbi:MAG: flagellar biosynthetic protein FliR [bacterium]
MPQLVEDFLAKLLQHGNRIDKMELFVTQFQKFFLVLARMSGIFVMAPFFGSLNILPRIKAGLCLFISLTIFGVVNKHISIVPNNFPTYSLLVFSEVAIGLIIGFMATLVISTFQISGELYSVPMGFGIVNTIDPLSQIEQPIIGQIIGLFALLVFLGFGGHHMMLIAICKSYEIVPVLTLDSCSIVAKTMVTNFAAMFLTALKISMPVMGVLFLVTLGMGLLAKVAPMMNIMVLGWAITIVAGMITLIFLFPLLAKVAVSLYEKLFYDIDSLLIVLGKVKIR